MQPLHCRCRSIHRRRRTSDTRLARMNEVIFTFPVSAVSALLQLQYQGDSLVGQPPVSSINLFILAILTSFFAVTASVTLPRKYIKAIRISSRLAICSVTLASASFISIIIPNKLCWVLYPPCISIIFSLLHEPCKRLALQLWWATVETGRWFTSIQVGRRGPSISSSHVEEGLIHEKDINTTQIEVCCI